MTKNIKLAMHTADLSDEKFLALQDLFPEAVTETITTDENGERVVTRAIDADVLQQLINKKVVSGKEERYQFTWPDKKKAILLANAPINKTLRPCREESVDFDNTENLYIEGDNLDVLKLLRETYLGKIKMIYIDPPYNTGNDFVYEDNFAEDTQEFLRRDNQIDEQGNRLVTNTESNGRFHTDWLNMMYPRLKLARELLTEDGVIFISINDSEISNLLKLCEDIFHFSNTEIMIWDKIANQTKAGSGKMKITHRFRNDHEYIVVCYKNIDKTYFNKPLKIMEYKNEYSNKDNDIRGNWLDTEICKSEEKSLEGGVNFYEIILPSGRSVKRQWHLSEDEFKELDRDRRIWWGSGDSIPRKKVFLSEPRPNTPSSVLRNQGGTSNGKEEMKNLHLENIFDNPKPTTLLSHLIEISTDLSSMILDFFSGSATTAQAVIQLNAEDNGNRKFIMVQFPEKTDKKSEAYKAGYENICEIGKERIRRSGKKVKDEMVLTASNLDTGFRVLKLDESNMNNVFYSPDEYKETNFKFEDLIENIKPDRTHEDILFQVMLELGVPLSAKIHCDGNIITVDDNYLVACFDTVDSDTVTRIAKMQPYYAVFRDSSFINDSSLINVEQIFNTYSPTTKRRVI